MKISAVYIAKNEEENISRSLESLKGLVDELILVDTGSVDDTVKIFQSYGGSVYHLSWSDDFSAPRNLAISKATGDWLILLDADEYFTYETVTNLRKVIEENLGYNGFYINITNINKITGEALDSFYTLRIVKKQKGLAYYGRIHEELLINGETIENAIFISKSLLNINHTGYTPEISEYKCRRNLKILKQELLEGYNPASLYTYFAECYDGIGDINNMLKYAWLDIEQGRRRVTYASRSYRKLIKYFAYNGTIDERLAVIRKALKDFPELPEFHAEIGACYEIKGCYINAIEELLLSVDLYINYKGFEPCLMNDEDVENILGHVESIIKKF